MGSGEGLGLVSIVADLGIDVRLTVLADSSAAIGICRRTGIGRVRRLAVGQLWVQERVRTGDCELRKHPGALNPADILTKPISANEMELKLRLVGASFVSDRRPWCSKRVVWADAESE